MRRKALAQPETFGSVPVLSMPSGVSGVGRLNLSHHCLISRNTGPGPPPGGAIPLVASANLQPEPASVRGQWLARRDHPRPVPGPRAGHCDFESLRVATTTLRTRRNDDSESA
jgi:hypothetical protein